MEHGVNALLIIRFKNLFIEIKKGLQFPEDFNH